MNFMRQIGTTTGLAIAAGLLLASGQAAMGLTYNQALREAATESGQAGQMGTYQFNDRSGADFYDRGTGNSGSIGVGDVILGAFVLDEISTNGGAGVLTNASGIYGLQVEDTGTNNSSINDNDVLFKSIDPSVGSGLTGNGTDAASLLDLGNGEMFAAYQGGLPTAEDENPPEGAFFDPKYSDGDKYAGLSDGGRDSSDTFPGYRINFESLSLSALSGISGQIGATGNSFLDVVDDEAGSSSSGGEGIGDNELGTFQSSASPPVAAVSPTTTISQTDEGGDLHFKDTASFDIKIRAVPEPATALGGLMMFGILGTWRRKKAEA